nr:GrBNV_gp06-like protein [Apis mellifera nudivirus]
MPGLYNRPGAGLMGAIAMNNKRQPIPITNIMMQEKAEDPSVMEALNRDFEILTNMTLIDDEINLDTLFLRQATLSNRVYSLNLLLNLYKLKYTNLITRYPSIQIWLTFCLTTLIYNNESKLLARCSGASISFIPTTVTHQSFGLINRKRKRFGSSSVVSGSGSSSSSSEKKLALGKKPNHPFLETNYYIEHPMLFKIGQMTKYCIPTEFALRFVNIKPGPVSKIVAKNDKSMYPGLRGTFMRPVVSLMTIRRVQNYPFVTIPFMDNIGQLVSSMTQLSPEADIFNMGIRQNMKVEDLIDADIISYSADDKKMEEGTVMLMALLTTFQCVGTSAGTVDIRSYANGVYRFNNAKIEVDDQQMKGFEATNLNHEAEYLQILNDYDDKLVQMGYKIDAAIAEEGDDEETTNKKRQHKEGEEEEGSAIDAVEPESNNEIN